MEIVTYHSSDNCATAIVLGSGPKWTKIIQVEASGLRIRKIQNSETKNFTDLLYKGKPYPLKRAVRRYLKSGKLFGITKPARQALKGV